MNALNAAFGCSGERPDPHPQHMQKRGATGPPLLGLHLESCVLGQLTVTVWVSVGETLLCTSVTRTLTV